MCGIAGVVDFRGRPVDEQRLRQCCEQLGHRGPDDAGTCVTRHGGMTVGLAHTRLAVIDPSPKGHQPMTAPTAGGALHIVFNGEIYNFRQLRQELASEGWAFQSDCDTEVVLAAYARWGESALNRFNGMWGLALFDTSTGTGLLARDRFGIKPLYYAEHEDRLMFYSEMSALACSW